MVHAQEDAYDDRCTVCGWTGRFVKDERPTRESFCCASCKASLRYQGQARVLLSLFSRHEAATVAELVKEPEFAALDVWEPGELGPFRRHFRSLKRYQTSSFWPDVLPGATHGGVRCEDLMDLSFEDASLDLIITSDVFEHVRKPWDGFAEVRRVLRPGGAHVFSLPLTWPMREQTVARVDVSGPDDVFLLDPAYHKIHLVYNDFGLDLLEGLGAMGLETTAVRFTSSSDLAERLLSFYSVKASG